MALRFHVVLSELFPEPAPAGRRRCKRASTHSSSAATSRSFSPRLAPSGRSIRATRTSAPTRQTDTPLLILTGTLDPATPTAIAAPFGEHYQGEHQHYVEVERASHNVLGDACGQNLLYAFFANPLAPLDTSCAANTPLLDFVGTAEDNEHFFGTPDAYENP